MSIFSRFRNKAKGNAASGDTNDDALLLGLSTTTGTTGNDAIGGVESSAEGRSVQQSDNTGDLLTDAMGLHGASPDEQSAAEASGSDAMKSSVDTSYFTADVDVVGMVGVLRDMMESEYGIESTSSFTRSGMYQIIPDDMERFPFIIEMDDKVAAVVHILSDGTSQSYEINPMHMTGTRDMIGNIIHG